MFSLKNMLNTTDGLPFTISPSTSYLRLCANEVGKDFVEFTGWFQTEDRHATIRFDFFRAISARLLAFSDEAGQGIGVVRRSKWLPEANKYQKSFYPAHADNFKDMKHFFLRGHDCSVEVLAEGFTWSEVNV